MVNGVGATYPFNVSWEELTLKDWQKFNGNYGFPLSKCKNLKEVYENLPNYVKTQKNTLRDTYFRRRTHVYEPYFQ